MQGSRQNCPLSLPVQRRTNGGRSQVKAPVADAQPPESPIPCLRAPDHYAGEPAGPLKLVVLRECWPVRDVGSSGVLLPHIQGLTCTVPDD
jgi:hypothetical protein